MSPGRILVIEDNPITRRMVRFALESEGYEVVEAPDGRTGLELASEKRPDLVVQDYVLPDMDGLEVLRRVRALPHGDTIPVLMVTGMASQIEDLGLRAAGPTTILPKPLEPSRMLEIVREHLTRQPVERHKGRRILLVDDDPITSKLAAIRFRDAGFDVESASGGEDALRRARGSPPDVILSDVLMPGLDGFALCRAVREDDRLGRVPVVLLSSSFLETEDRELARQVGASTLLVRTPDFAEAIAAVNAAMENVGLPTPRPKAEVEALHAKRVQLQLEKQVARNELLLRQGAIQAAALSVVRGLAQALANPYDLPNMLGDILVHCLDAAGLSTGLLYLPGSDGELRLQAQAGIPSAVRETAAQCFGHPELLKRVFNGTQPVAYRFDRENDGDLLQFGARLGRTSCLLMPFVSNQEHLGGLLMASDSQDLTEPSWLGFASALGTQFAQTIAVGRFMTRGAVSEVRHRTLLDNANDAILATNDSLVIVEANRSAKELLGDDIVGRPYADLVVPEQRHAIVNDTGRVEGRRLIRPDGSVVTVNLSLARVEIGDERLSVAILRNVTDRVTLEAQLRQAQKMEAVGRLAGGVAHDFNNILGVITGFGELAKRQLATEHPVQGRLDQILKAAGRAADLTRQLLAFSRQQLMRPRPLDLNQAIESAQSMLARLIGEDIEIRTHLQSHLGTVIADPTQVDQVLFNLAVNARDAMETGGTLTFETANVEIDETYVNKHAAGRPGSYVMLSVSDTGMGMDEATRAQIFEPFFTTKPEGKGTGMGLATVYGIVKQSNGFIWVYSEPKHGATFKIYLPRADAKPDQEAAASDTAVPTGGTETILLVEDQQPLREMIEELLQERGYTVMTATDGQAALETASQHKGPVDLLITDVIMPGMNGAELAEKLNASRPNIRILYMSGYSNGGVSDRGLLVKEANLIEKPFTSQALARAVRRTLEQP